MFKLDNALIWGHEVLTLTATSNQQIYFTGYADWNKMSALGSCSSSASDKTPTNNNSTLADQNASSSEDSEKLSVFQPLDLIGGLTDVGCFSYAAVCAAELFNLFQNSSCNKYVNINLNSILDVVVYDIFIYREGNIFIDIYYWANALNQKQIC